MLRWCLTGSEVSQVSKVYVLVEGEAPGAEVLRMDVFPAGGKVAARCVSALGEFTLERQGFWAPEVVALDAGGGEVCRVVSPGWWSSRRVFSLAGQGYEIGLRNNPLAELVILRAGEAGEPLVAVGLKVAGDRPVMGLAVGPGLAACPRPDVLHGLAWLFFHLVAEENMEAAEFLLLVA